MILRLRQRSGSRRHVRKPGILGNGPLFEVGNLRDSNLFGEAQKLSVMGANLFNAMAVI